MGISSLHISLSEQLKDEVRARVDAGRFSNTTDYVRHLIRQDILRNAAQVEFSAFIKQGMESPSCGQTAAEMFADIRQEIQSEDVN